MGAALRSKEREAISLMLRSAVSLGAFKTDRIDIKPLPKCFFKGVQTCPLLHEAYLKR